MEEVKSKKMRIEKEEICGGNEISPVLGFSFLFWYEKGSKEEMGERGGNQITWLQIRGPLSSHWISSFFLSYYFFFLILI